MNRGEVKARPNPEEIPLKITTARFKMKGDLRNGILDEKIRIKVWKDFANKSMTTLRITK